MTFLEPYKKPKLQRSQSLRKKQISFRNDFHQYSLREKNTRHEENGTDHDEDNNDDNDDDDDDDEELIEQNGDATAFIEYEDFSSSNKVIKKRTTLLVKHDRHEQARSKSLLPIEPSKLYVAKSLVLISRLEYIDLFKSCLSLIYAVYVDKRHNTDNRLLETIIANLLCVHVNGPGTALSNTFTLGADDRHLVQATASLTVPATGSSVFKLFKEIGIVNVVKLVCAILADFKILFFSRSYTKLYDACRAVEALLFPLKYTGKYSFVFLQIYSHRQVLSCKPA